MLRWRLPGLVATIVTCGAASLHHETPPLHNAEIVTNDNRAAAGRLRDGVLSINLVAGAGTWFPEKTAGPGHDVYAFGEEGGALQIPGPLLRVSAGTTINATIRNTLAHEPLVVHGLHDRPGALATVTVPAGEKRAVSFRVTQPGTYLYWGTTRGVAGVRDRFGMESQLLGALIVDPPGARRDDHVFVISVEDDSAATPAERTMLAAAINGLSWPHAAPIDVDEGDTVRVRWINASDRPHPIHLHGFYFRVDSRGDNSADTIYSAQQRRLAVTEHMLQGHTMTATWVAERPGNWLMHCHMALHMSPVLRRGAKPQGAHSHAMNHTLEMMSGLVTGWRVSPKSLTTPVSVPPTAARRLRLLVHSSPRRYGDLPAVGFVLQQGNTPPRADSVDIPGTPLVLTRGEPVEITVVNRLQDATSIHWHGIELDSYFDGVSGWSGAAGSIAPSVAPRDSFIVRFTPPRAGTFMYHSHFDEEAQLAAGMYGALIVVEPGSGYDAQTDITWVLGAGGTPDLKLGPTLLNGSLRPTIELVAGKRYRIRLINIQPNLPVRFAVLQDTTPIRWRAIAKDGADLPAHQAVQVPASLSLGVGEAYDFELTPATPGELRLRVTELFRPIERLSGVIRIR